MLLDARPRDVAAVIRLRRACRTDLLAAAIPTPSAPASSAVIKPTAAISAHQGVSVGAGR